MVSWTEKIMAMTSIYKNHFIFTDGLFDRTRGQWIPIVDVSWTTLSGSNSHIVNRRRGPYKSKEDAEKSGVKIGKAWIDTGRQLSILDSP
jgi:hypothetical protein